MHPRRSVGPDDYEHARAHTHTHRSEPGQAAEAAAAEAQSQGVCGEYYTRIILCEFIERRSGFSVCVCVVVCRPVLISA